MSKTPRTDEKEFAAIDLKPSARVVYASFCRQLETELAEARAEIERKDKLIEQMREALRAWMRTPNVSLREAIKATEAALEAAEK